MSDVGVRGLLVMRSSEKALVPDRYFLLVTSARGVTALFHPSVAQLPLLLSLMPLVVLDALGSAFRRCVSLRV